MFLCFVNDGVGGWITSQVTATADCMGFVAQSADSYSDLALLFKTYFEFDESLFSLIVGFLLWVVIFLVVTLVLYFLWEEFNG